ncbi:MAG TPA: alpha/beta hydrolase, partial [Burkholderiales bacterium]|nr:alpha/beta hydrolase [Burkholderiales bacterium]
MHKNLPMDPELAPAYEAWRSAMKGGIDLNDIPATRKLMAELASKLPKPDPVPGIRVQDMHASAPKGGKDVLVRIYRPEDNARVPAVLWIHGGGYVLGDIERDHATCMNLAKFANCLIASVDYRLAP